MRRKLLSLLLVACMVLPLVPLAALPVFATVASGADEENEVVYSTTFSPDSENFPTFPELPKDEKGKYIMPGTVGKWIAVNYHGNWDMGYKTPTVLESDAYGPKKMSFENDTFTLYNALTIPTATEAILGVKGLNYWDVTGGVYIAGGTANMMFSGMPYTTKVAGADSANANTRSCTAYNAVSTIRYKAEYAGIISIDIANSFYFAGSSLYILHNGDIVYSYTSTANDPAALYYHNGQGTLRNGNLVRREVEDAVADLVVNKNDTIEFVSFADPTYDYDDDSGNAESTTVQSYFDYQRSKRGVQDYEFTINYLNRATDSDYSSAFGPNAANYPVVDLDAKIITYPDAWTVGSIQTSATKDGTTFKDVTISTNFREYQSVDTSAGHAVTNGGGTWGSDENGGGALWLGKSYTNVMSMGVNYNGGTANERTVQSFLATSAVRYTAEYTGDMVVSYNVGYYSYGANYPSNGTYLVVRHVSNGEVVRDYTQTPGQLTGNITIENVKFGDFIYFISMPDLDYDADSFTTEKFGGTNFEYQNGKRGLIIKEFAVDYVGSESDVLTETWLASKANNQLVTQIYNTNKLYLPSLYLWYKTDGTQLISYDAGTGKYSIATEGLTAESGYYAYLNPLFDTATDETDVAKRYAVAVENYREAMKKATELVYHGNFTMQGINMSNTDMLSTIRYLGFYSGITVYGISASGQVERKFGGSHYVTEKHFNEAFDKMYLPTGATYATDTGATYTTSGNTKLVMPVVEEGTNKLLLTFDSIATVYASVTGAGSSGGFGQVCLNKHNNVEPGWNNRPGSTTLAGVLAYTVPEGTPTSLVELSFANTKFYDTTVTTFNWCIAVNDEIVFPAGAQMNKNTTWQVSEMTSDFGALLADLEIYAKGGDQVRFMFCRGAGGYDLETDMTVKLTTPKPFCKVEYYADDAKQNAWLVDFGADISGLIPASDKGYAVNGKYVTELPTVANGDMKFEEFSLSVGTGLEIKDAYAVYLKLAVPGNPYEVGAIVDGVEIPATKVSEGTYKVIVKGNIKVFELTHSTASNKTADAEGTSVTYTPYVKKTADAEIYTGEETTVCTRDLLNTYITGDYDATTKAFAVAIRALACETAAEYAKIAGAVLDSTTKTDIKGSSYQTRDRAGVIAALKTLYPELADVLDDNCNFYNYNKTPILLADGSGAVYANYAVTDTNMMLQAYQDYVKGESVLSSIPGNDYRVWVAPNGGTFEEATAYYYPYAAVAKVLNDAQKASVDTKYMDADGNKLDDAVVKDETKYDYKIVGANVNLGDKISLVFLANGNGENSTSALSAYYENGYKLKVTAPSGDVYYGDFRMTEVNGKEYAGVIVGVPIAFYNDALDIVIVQVDAETKAETEVSAHLQYNVLTWCANKYVFDRDYILRGVYNLGVKAKAYVEAHS